MVIAGWIVLGLFALFMLGASVFPKFAGMDAATNAMEAIGYPTRHILMIGVLEALFTLLVLIPRTGAIGGVLMTGLLGGAIASNLRADMPLASHTLFGIYLGCFMWIGLLLRDADLRATLTPL